MLTMCRIVRDSRVSASSVRDILSSKPLAVRRNNLSVCDGCAHSSDPDVARGEPSDNQSVLISVNLSSVQWSVHL